MCWSWILEEASRESAIYRGVLPVATTVNCMDAIFRYRYSSSGLIPLQPPKVIIASPSSRSYTQLGTIARTIGS